jgi:CBS domain-containing protein
MKRTQGESTENKQPHKRVHTTEEKKWLDLLSDTTVGTLLKERKKKLVVIDKNATLGEAMAVLKRENILSLPVVDEKQKKFLGFVDVLDIAEFVLSTWKYVSATMDEIHFPTDDVFDAPLLNILNLSHVNHPSYIEENASVSDLLSKFLDRKNYFRLHRLAVTDESGDVVDVVSQSDVVAFAHHHIDSFPKSKKDLKLGLLSGLIRTPLMVRIDSPFVDALEVLCKNKISGLALIDHEFKLSGNISVSDLRGMNPLAFDFFNGSTLQFMAKGTDSPSKVTQSLGPGNTFGETITRLATERIHRLYITGEHGHPVGFVSLIDVIARLK